MEITPTNASEEREEGEIVEDDLEDVSDCSMTPGSPFHSGKSVSPPELLSAVCLSSVSSSEYNRADGHRVREKAFQYYGKGQPKRRLYRRKRKLGEHNLKRKNSHHLHRRRKSMIESNSDSDSESVDPKYAKQLREALRRESSQELQNSLKTRLKAFIEPNSHSDDDTNLNDLRNLALLSTLKKIEDSDEHKLADDKCSVESENLQLIGESEIAQAAEDEENQKDNGEVLQTTNMAEDSEKDKKIQENKENIDDPELQELRIAALKSFVIENHERRKRRAAVQDCNADNLCSGSSNKDDASDIDKENDQSVMNNDADAKSCKKLKSDVENIVSEIANDLNIDKATNNISANHVDSLVEEDTDILRAILLASMSTKLAGKPDKDPIPNITSGFPKTISDIRRVEKSKINYNSLSVTFSKPNLRRTIKNDLCTNKTTNSNDHKTNQQSSISTHVVVKPLIIRVNGESDSDTENTTINDDNHNNTLKDNVTKFLKKQRAEVEAAVNKKPESSDSSLNKSDDLLMDKSVMKLLPRSQQLEYRKLKQMLNARKRTRIRRASQKVSESKREIVQNVKKVPKSKTDALISTSNANGKLIRNIEEKKITEPASNLQKTLNDLQIRKNGRLQMKGKYRTLAQLLYKINQASNERRQHELEIKKLLQEIQKARTKLASSHQNFTQLVQQLVQQKSTIDQRSVYKIAKLSHGPFTSTPNKLIKKQQVNNITSVTENTAIVENNTNLDNSTKIDSNMETVIQEQNLANNTYGNVAAEPNDTNCNKVHETEEVLLEDPNDITKVFVEQPVTFPKYTSPLDNRDGINDPLTTICPYDLLGVCKDKECRYMHCS